MSLGEKLRGHLPYLRRYARALTGGQQSGDAYVRATLETIVGAPSEFDDSVGTRPGLYRVFHKIWQSVHVDGGTQVDPQNEIEKAALKKLSIVTPLSRQALLLTALEGFREEEVAFITGLAVGQIDQLLTDAMEELDRETRTNVLIIEDEPLISMELEQIVRDLGHDIAGTAATHKDALTAVEKTRPGLVLADIQLADGSSGIDAVQDIVRQSPVPVIFITAFPEKLLTGDRPEPAFLITKPFQTSAVKAAISQALFFELKTVMA
ncbi:response regulator [Sphingorhabdus arenilitoris]|uniref:Response regulator n=1 Tax=Sphingorhabdus arenilitoris TaxID=1490041 RepID=A0ABV8RC39_9SPHN